MSHKDLSETAINLLKTILSIFLSNNIQISNTIFQNVHNRSRAIGE